MNILFFSWWFWLTDKIVYPPTKYSRRVHPQIHRNRRCEGKECKQKLLPLKCPGFPLDPFRFSDPPTAPYVQTRPWYSAHPIIFQDHRCHWLCTVRVLCDVAKFTMPHLGSFINFSKKWEKNHQMSLLWLLKFWSFNLKVFWKCGYFVM